MNFPSEGFGQTLSSAAVPEDEADRDAGLDEDGPSS
jgi:hypothetical protein